MGWKYFLPEADKQRKSESRLDEQLTNNHTDFNVQDIKLIDPCMGGGHILVYAFEVLMQIYLERGYARRDAVKHY